AIDILARGLLNAAAMLEGGDLISFVTQRYAGWRTESARAMLEGRTTVEAVAEAALADNLAPAARSGRQEYLENVVSRYTSSLGLAKRRASAGRRCSPPADAPQGGLKATGVRTNHAVASTRLDYALHGDIP